MQETRNPRASKLVPLPPDIWHGLPGRETIITIDRLLGQADLWRPISLTPSDTWNSLLGMTVPLAAVFLIARLDAEDYPRLLAVFVAIAVVSAMLGFMQVLLGTGMRPLFIASPIPTRWSACSRTAIIMPACRLVRC